MARLLGTSIYSTIGRTIRHSFAQNANQPKPVVLDSYSTFAYKHIERQQDKKQQLFTSWYAPCTNK